MKIDKNFYKQILFAKGAFIMANVNFKGYDSPLATRLRGLMKEHNKKQSDIAELLGITRQSVSQYCDGSALPPVDKIVILADYFNVSTDYLLGRTDIIIAEPDVIAVCKHTGLSDESILQLNEWNITNIPEFKNILYTLNKFICIEDSEDVFNGFVDLFNLINDMEKIKKAYLGHKDIDLNQISNMTKWEFSIWEDNQKNLSAKILKDILIYRRLLNDDIPYTIYIINKAVNKFIDAFIIEVSKDFYSYGKNGEETNGKCNKTGK